VTFTYLVLVELAKARFYAGRHPPVGPPTTHTQRLDRRIRRRAARFAHHVARGGHTGTEARRVT
jgi:hypothetical protein